MVGSMADWGDDERRLTDTVSVLVGDANGAYPSGNTLLVRGAGESVLIDPSVTVVARGGAPVPVDAVINSHSHEDHMAGNGTFPIRPSAHPRRRPPGCAVDGGPDGGLRPDRVGARPSSSR
jgi:glyoxylase-like metal-dependent hydrolase (beta-lactamase superfamily II)